jgi:hypothetical protein
MEPADAPTLDESPAAPVPGRLRLAVCAALALLWFAPWGQVLDLAGATRTETGAEATGAPGALALVALWGVGAALLLARTRRGMRIGAAVADTAIALLSTGLLAFLHPWLPGGSLRELWVPVFGPLAALALVEAVGLARRDDSGSEVTAIRAGAGLFAAATLFVAGAWVPAATALWLGVLPLALLRTRSAEGSRVVLEAAFLVAAAAAYTAPLVHSAILPGPDPTGDPTPWPLAWSVLTAALGVGAVLSLGRRLAPKPLP